MKIWKVWSEADDYEKLSSAKKSFYQESQTFNGQSKLNGWSPLALKPSYGNRPYGDWSTLLSLPLVTPRVIEATKDLIENQVEVLPTICSDCELYILNITNIVDAVDYTKSVVKYFPNSTKVLRFIKLAFVEEKVRNNHIFNLVEKKLSVPYVSDEFRQRIIDNELTGFKFELVWDSEVE